MATAALRWLVAGTMVATAHGAAVWIAVDWHPREAAASEPPPAMMIELAPLAVTPDLVPIPSVAAAESAPSEPEIPPETTKPPPQAEPTATPEPASAQPEPPKQAPPEVKPSEPAPPPPPAPEPQPTPPEVPAPAPVPLPEPPKLEPPKPEESKPEAPKPPAPPKVEQPEIEPPKRDQAKPEPKPAEVKKPDIKTEKVETSRPKKPAERKVAARTKSAAAPRSADAKATLSNRSAAPSAGAGVQSVSPASWKSRLLAHLNRYKRFPPGARAGSTSVAFTIDRDGRVLAVRLAGSSGDDRLDGEAMNLVRRASPLPAPPEGFGGGRIALTVPIRFNR